jgi:hypothetical protein
MKKVTQVSDHMIRALERRGERRPIYSNVVSDSDYIKFLNECLEEVDPGAKKAFQIARELYEGK